MLLCVSERVIVRSDDGLAPIPCQAIAWEMSIEGSHFEPEANLDDTKIYRMQLESKYVFIFVKQKLGLFINVLSHHPSQ